MYPLLVTGSRDGLTSALAAAIRCSVQEDGLLAQEHAETIGAITDPFEAILNLRDAVQATGIFDGLLLVIDEMGKFLEASGQSDGSDVFRLQALAENAARSGGKPLGILLVLHKGFQSYAEDLRISQKGEWAKVAERFEELIFDHPLSHTAALMSSALAVDAARLPPKVFEGKYGGNAANKGFGMAGSQERERDPTLLASAPCIGSGNGALFCNIRAE